MTPNDLATARMQVRIASGDLTAAEMQPALAEVRRARVANATEVLDTVIIACAALLNGGES
jgi:hypothetical protein